VAIQVARCVSDAALFDALTVLPILKPPSQSMMVSTACRHVHMITSLQSLDFNRMRLNNNFKQAQLTYSCIFPETLRNKQ